MLLELLDALGTDVLGALELLVDHFEPAAHADELARAYRLRETILAKSMEPTRAFDEMMLYQLTKASSTAQFLERCAGLSPAEARSSTIMARKLKAMPLTEAAWLAGTLSSGQVRAITANVKKQFADRFRDDEAEMLAIVVPLDAKGTDLAMQKWVNVVQASLDDDPEKPLREDEFFHSAVGSRYVSNGNFGAVTGEIIDKAIELCEADNPRDKDTRSPAQRRGEALADVCGFYVDYQNRITADPDAPAPAVPKKRNWPQLIAVNTTDELQRRQGAQLING
ncbi:MAG: DUF222 domain-containing protein, partial [Acidimicrobiales bacterium]